MTARAAHPSSIVFIDSRVADHQRLIDTLPLGTPHRLLDGRGDALAQIAAHLRGSAGLDALHLLSHGSEGCLHLGDRRLDADSLDDDDHQLAAIGAALGDYGEILLYGCEVGRGAAGQALLRALAAATGAHVRAASQPVGHPALGGTWTLDVGEGQHAALAFPEWRGRLGMIISFKQQAYPGKWLGEAANSQAFAALRADGSLVTWGDSDYGGDSSAVASQLDGTVDVTQVFSTSHAFAALRADGSLVTWGNSSYGGDSSVVANQLNGTVDVTQVFSNDLAFAALRADGSLVTWGYSSFGGDSRAVASQIDGTVDVTQVFSNDLAFAALRADGSLVTWGDSSFGGDSRAVANQLDGTVDVTQVFSNDFAFAALRADGSLVTWGDSSFGGDSRAVASQIDGTVDVTQVFSTYGDFAALRADGSLVTWGNSEYFYDSSAIVSRLDGTIDVTQVFSNHRAFAALRADGSLVTWGAPIYGGDSSEVTSQIDGTVDVTRVFSNFAAFAALRADGSLVTWGLWFGGGDSSEVASQLDGMVDVTQVFSTNSAFAALRADGSLVAWGDSDYGGDSRGVASQLDGTVDVTQVFSNYAAFAALRADGSLVTWGDSDYGGDSSAVASQLDGTVDVTQVFSTSYAFAALRADGSLVTWGNSSFGGDSSAVASQLTNIVGLANAATDDVFTSSLNLVGTAADNLIIGGSGNETLNGAGGNDTLLGGAGVDVLDGGSGADSLAGGDGNDYYFVDNIGDLVVENNAGATGGTDVVYSTLAGYALSANVEIGRILSTGSANLSGNGLANVLYANIGDNVLDGGAGADTVSWQYGVSGGTGVTANLTTGTASGSGSDTLIGIEHLTGSANGDSLTGDRNANLLDGGDGNDNLNGAAGNDTLRGGAGVDVLDGGSGADSLAGGDGNDYYFVDNIGDLVVENNAGATGGTDVVYSTLAGYALSANVEIGRILSTGSANLSGNGLANVLYANIGDNVLDGGAGADTVSWQYGVSGGTGVTANLNTGTASGSGSDTLIGIEHLTGSANGDSLTGDGNANTLDGGDGNDNLNGAGGNDTLRGGAGVDVLDGGSGADSLAGGDGNDYYFVDSIGDLVVENSASATGGTDVVYSALAGYALTANVEIGRILATSFASLAGNNLANTLFADVGDNVLDGGAGNDTLAGGLGNDWLIGGSGADTFRFDTLPNGESNRDAIIDFSVIDDSIELENAVFSALASGPLAAGAFRFGAGAIRAADADDLLIYDTTTGALYYDDSGNTNTTGPLLIALIGSAPALTSADFVVT